MTKYLPHQNPTFGQIKFQKKIKKKETISKKKNFLANFFMIEKNMIFEKCFELRPMCTHVAGLKRGVAPS